MPVGRQPPEVSRIWPSGGAHLWPSGGTSAADSHRRGHLVYAAKGVLSVHTEGGTSIVPANRVGWTPAGFAHHHRAQGHTDMRIVFLPAPWPVCCRAGRPSSWCPIWRAKCCSR